MSATYLIVRCLQLRWVAVKTVHLSVHLRTPHILVGSSLSRLRLTASRVQLRTRNAIVKLFV